MARKDDIDPSLETTTLAQLFDLHEDCELGGEDPYGVLGDDADAAAAAHVEAPKSDEPLPPPVPEGGAIASLVAAVIATFKRYGLPAAGIALILSSALAILLPKKMQPSYAAEAVLSIDPIMPRVLHTNEEWRATSIHSYFNDYTRTLVHYAVERKVIARAIRHLQRRGVQWAPEGMPESHAINHLRSRIGVTLVRETHLLTLGFTDSNRRVVAPVVNTVARSFLRSYASENRQQKDINFRALMRERRRLARELADVYGQLDDLSDRLGSALLDGRQNIFYERVQIITSGVTRAFVTRSQMEGALLAAKREAEALQGPVPEGLILAAMDDDPALRDMRITFAKILGEEQVASAGLTDEHPTRQKALAKIRLGKKDLEETEAAVRARVTARIAKLRENEAKEILIKAQNDYDAAILSEDAMVGVMDEARDDLTTYGRAMFEGSKLRTAAERLLNALDNVDRRIDELRVESRAPIRIAMRTPAFTPLQPASNSGPLMGAVAAVGVWGMAFGILLVLSKLLPRVYHPYDLEAREVRVLACTEWPTGPKAAAAMFGGLERVHTKAPLSLVFVPATEEDVEAAETCAETMIRYTGPRHRALLLRLEGRPGDARDGDSGLPMLETTSRGGVRLGPLGGRDDLDLVLTSAEFRERYTRKAATYDVRVVAAPPIDARVIDWPFFREGYKAVIVATKGVTPTGPVGNTAAAILAGGGEVVGGVIVDPKVLEKPKRRWGLRKA